MTLDEMGSLFRQVSESVSREIYRCEDCRGKINLEDYLEKQAYTKHKICKKCYQELLGGNDM